NMQQIYLNYEINRRNLVLTIRQKDQAFEQIIAPPAGAAQGTQQNTAAVQTTNLINFQTQLLNRANTLVIGRQASRTARLSLYRGRGMMPYDDWDAFPVLFPEEPVHRDGVGTGQRTPVGPPMGPAMGPPMGPAMGPPPVVPVGDLMAR